MAAEWHAVMARTTWAPGYAHEVLRRFERDVFPAIGDKPISLIRRDDVISLLERKLLGSRAAANNLRQNLQSVFESWVDRELIERNPAAKLAKRFAGADRAPQPAALTIADARAVLAAVEGQDSALAIRLLNRFQGFDLRPAERGARGPRWTEFDGSGVWRIPAERMKGRRGRKVGHEVPLSRQAQEVLDVAREVLNRNSPFVFPALHRGTYQAVSRSTISELMLRALPAGLKARPARLAGDASRRS